jgi:hypothetical protein
MFEIAVFTDDITQDLDHALDVVAEFGLEWRAPILRRFPASVSGDDLIDMLTLW